MEEGWVAKLKPFCWGGGGGASGPRKKIGIKSGIFSHPGGEKVGKQEDRNRQLHRRKGFLGGVIKNGSKKEDG